MSSVPKPIIQKTQWNKLRLCDMFFHGASDAELGECLKKKKLQLIAARVRASNVPPNHLGKAKFIADMGDEALEHIKEWFYMNGKFSDLPSVADACERLAAHAGVGRDAVSKKEAYVLWRSVLHAFAGNVGKPVVESFLTQVPVLGQPATSAVQTGIPLGDLDANDGLLLSLGRGQSASLARPGVAVIAGLVAAARHDGVTYSAAKQKLLDLRTPVGTRFASVLDSLYKQSYNHQVVQGHGQPKPALGLADVDLGDREQMVVIGVRQRVLDNGTFFVHILGIIQDGHVIELAPGEAREIFLENGDAIAFPHTTGLVPPNDHGLGVWGVLHMDTDKSAHYSVTRYERRVYDVVEVPHPKEDPDKVRIWIQQSYKPHQDVCPLFRLADGTIFRLSGDVTDPANANFDFPLVAYNDLPLSIFHKRLVFAGVFPAPHKKFDCAPAHVLVKRLFKAKSSLASLAQVTKAEVNELAALAAAEATDEALRNSLERAKGKVGALIDGKAMLDAVIDDILKLPEVKARLDEERQRVASELVGQAAAANQELAKLQADKAQLQSELKNLKASIDREAASLASEVKKAFEAASAEGMKTLGQVAVISRALGIGGGGVQPRDQQVADDAVAGTGSTFAQTGTCIGTKKQLNATIAQWALGTGWSSKLMHAAIAASANGVIALAGPRQEELYEFLVGTVSGGIACDLSVSADMFSVSDLLNAPAVVRIGKQAQAMSLGEFLCSAGGQPRARTVRLHGVNRVPPESLLPELLDVCRSPPTSRQLAWTDKRGATRLLQLSTPIVFILDFVQGRSVFPCYPPTSMALPVVDTGAPWGDYCDAELPDAKPCAFIDAGYYFESLGPDATASLPPTLEALPQGSLSTAARLYTAACATGMATEDASTFAIAALGVGRVPRDKLPATTGGQAWQKYFDGADTLFGQAFFEKDGAK
ncbi:MAG TPA: hypothetical protein VJ698_14125 [Noviherbaspirillum sp.]|uniref:coiled-coil domain-containing protein n=1 Tax=Noviherbaspirillum sp. TaxID=1926288 RepID=UPI002B4822A5|nr:hypothetical protein [Noviherbaspirillum sp.]HJV86604.1 hypothetical protein [Noviherbaspirillum sp.]